MERREMIRGLIIVGVIVVGVLIREFGQYADEVNPYNRYDVGNDFEEVEE